MTLKKSKLEDRRHLSSERSVFSLSVCGPYVVDRKKCFLENDETHVWK